MAFRSLSPALDFPASWSKLRHGSVARNRIAISFAFGTFVHRLVEADTLTRGSRLASHQECSPIAGRQLRRLEGAPSIQKGSLS